MTMIPLSFDVTQHLRETADGWRVEMVPYEPRQIELRIRLYDTERREVVEHRWTTVVPETIETRAADRVEQELLDAIAPAYERAREPRREAAL